MVLGLVVLFQDLAELRCVSMESQHKCPTSPTLEITTLEFPGERVLPIGYNITVICTSNTSKQNHGDQGAGQPFWIKYFSPKIYDYCGGQKKDAEDSKRCKFLIRNATKTDSGNYKCKSENQITCTEGTLNLTFTEPLGPFFKVDLPNTLHVTTGSRANLTCQASGIPRPVIKWFKNGHHLLNSSVRGFKGHSMLAFASISLDDQGDYWCVAKNIKGWIRSSTVNFIVTWKPIFTRHPQNTPVHFYDGAAMVTLECAVDGFPRPVISWLENNSTVINETVNQNGSVSSLTLVFHKISEQALSYRCVARNSVGTTLSKEATLTFPESSSSITNSSTPVQSHGQGDSVS